MKKILTNGNMKGIIIAISILLLTAGLLGIQSLMGLFKPDPPDVLQLDRETESSETAITESSVSETSAVSEASSESTALVETDPVISETTLAAGYDPDQSAGHIAAWKIDGKPVAMTYGEIAEFEKLLYQSKTQAEYEMLMDKLYYYNKGVDMSRFSWTWDEYKLLYSEEQIAMMRSGQRLYKTLPNIVGMEMKAAYRYLTDLGFLARFAFQYNASSTVPVGCCYYQDIAAGQKMYTDASIMFYIQAPPEFYGQSVLWHPDDQDFDIYAYIEKLWEEGKINIDIPDVVGMTAAEAQALLNRAGFENVRLITEYIDQNYAPGICYKMSPQPGTFATNQNEFILTIQDMYWTMPNVIGLSKDQAEAKMIKAGFTVECISDYRPDLGYDDGICFAQDHDPGTQLRQNTSRIYIHTVPPEKTTPTE